MSLANEQDGAPAADAAKTHHRLDGLEPDNLLAFMALLGLLRVLEHAKSEWRPRVGWTIDNPPLRPCLHLHVPAAQAEIAAAAASGIADLARAHVFDRDKLAFSQEEARKALQEVATTEASSDDGALWAALISDVAKREDKDNVDRTPFCLLDVAQTAFLKALREVALPSSNPKVGRKVTSLPEALDSALFRPWAVKDDTVSFRWDPVEDSRYALRATAPTTDKQGVEHGANVLGAIGLRSLTVVPQQAGAGVRLVARGGRSDRLFSMAWPIWRDTISLAAVESLLDHPQLRAPDMIKYLGIAEVRIAARFNPNGGKYSNFGRGRVLRP